MGVVVRAAETLVLVEPNTTTTGQTDRKSHGNSNKKPENSNKNLVVLCTCQVVATQTLVKDRVKKLCAVASGLTVVHVSTDHLASLGSSNPFL